VGDFGVNASFSFNEDGSKSFNLSVNASIPVLNTGLWFDAGIGLNVNTYTGASFSRSGSVCYGASKEVTCAGVEVGQGFSWDRSGGFNGMTVYAEAYVTYAGVRTSVGAEAGFFGAEGRGLYAGIGGYGLHAQVAQNGGFSWGVKESIYLHAGKIGKVSEDGKSRNVGLEIWIPTLGEYGHFGLGKTYDVSPAGLQKKQREEITKLLLGVDDELLARLNAEWDSDALGGKLSHTSVVRLNKWLVNNGFERVDRPNLLHGKNTQKLTWRHKGSSEYGNLEIIMPTCIAKNHPEWSGAYSSYNYGNNMISHFFIDVLW
ncbi:hypothetical protein, partial [Fibrobacter sp.]|uniref:hypothetical protein n=1 Tax=Fibrobacter sp. TaxID=35828 RepID=UPI00386D265B